MQSKLLTQQGQALVPVDYLQAALFALPLLLA